MSKFTTGELAKRAGVTVRTVQYYDARGILVPSELSEGGRRLYTDADLDRMRIICFLRDLGLPIESIRQLLNEEDPGSVISLLLDQQETALQDEIRERREKLDRLEALKRGLRNVETFTVESIGDIATTMTNNKKLRKTRIIMLLTGIPVTALQWVSIVLIVTKGLWLPFAAWCVIAPVYGTIVSRYYYRNVAYLCPKCHTVFRPRFKDMFFARHTPNTRKLTCTHCGHNGFAVEVAAEKEAPV